MHSMHCIPHVIPFIEQWFRLTPCHWLLDLTLHLARVATVLKLISQFFCSHTYNQFVCSYTVTLQLYVVLTLLRFGALPFVPNQT
jgi:hypothetical protein